MEIILRQRLLVSLSLDVRQIITVWVRVLRFSKHSQRVDNFGFSWSALGQIEHDLTTAISMFFSQT